jgi:thioredoxin reductase
MHLPLYGKVKLYDTTKHELLRLWNKVIVENKLQIQEHVKVDSIIPQPDDTFKVITASGEEYTSQQVLLATGRRGSPRKLNVPGEGLPKVAYRLLEPERINKKKIVVVGGGDSAVESAMLLMDENEVILSYRKDKFSRIKPKNRDNIQKAIDNHSLSVMYNSSLSAIEESKVIIKLNDSSEELDVENDLVYIFAGGELPTGFLKKAGIEVTKRFGHVLKKHG